jgi:hypothetical protein
MVLKAGIRNWIRICIEIIADPQPSAVLDGKLWAGIEFYFPLTSVADPGCFYWIRLYPSRIQG